MQKMLLFILTLKILLQIFPVQAGREVAFKDSCWEVYSIFRQIDNDLWYIKWFGWTGKVSESRFERLTTAHSALQQKLELIDSQYKKAQKKLLSLEKLANDKRQVDDSNPALAVIQCIQHVLFFPLYLLMGAIDQHEISNKKEYMQNLEIIRTYVYERLSAIKRTVDTHSKPQHS